MTDPRQQKEPRECAADSELKCEQDRVAFLVVLLDSGCGALLTSLYFGGAHLGLFRVHSATIISHIESHCSHL